MASGCHDHSALCNSPICSAWATPTSKHQPASGPLYLCGLEHRPLAGLSPSFPFFSGLPTEI